MSAYNYLCRMSIEVKNLVKIFGVQAAVNNISFSAQKGEIVGFLGPNGAGKSTTMKILTNYIQPTSGEAWIAGWNIATHPMESKRKIGYLPEHNPLYLDMYVKEYLAFTAAVYKVSNSGKRIAEVLELTGLGAEMHKKTGQLSKGYRQRVGLAAAIIHEPDVLILDEPTTGLDPNQIVEIREVIRGIGQKSTIIFSSHILQEVEAICQRVIIINKGEIVTDQPMQALLSSTGAGDYLIVRFAEPLEAEWLQRLPATDAVDGINPYSYKVYGKDALLLKKQILAMALQHNLNIVSLHSENGNLEAIFRSLTQKTT